METQTVVPLARPVVTGAPIVTAHVTDCVVEQIEPSRATPRTQTERMSVASAICGMTAFIPIVSQLAGLVFGVLGLARIRRLRAQGVRCDGTGWAWMGITTSMIALIGWVATGVLMAILGRSMQDSLTALQALTGR